MNHTNGKGLSATKQESLRPPKVLGTVNDQVNIPKPAIWFLIGVLVAAALNAWIILGGMLPPLWSEAPEGTFLTILVSALAGVSFTLLTIKIKRGPKLAMGFLSLLLLLPFPMAMLAPLLLYINCQVDLNESVCYPYRLADKQYVRYTKGGAHKLTLTSAHLPSKTLDVTQAQFDVLIKGGQVSIQVGRGLFGVSYVKHIGDHSEGACQASVP